MPSSNPSSINARKVSPELAAERAEARKRAIERALASTAGQGAAGVEEGDEAKEVLQKDKGGSE